MKKLISIGIITLVVIGAIVAVVYILGFKTVTFNLQKSGYEVVVQDSDEKQVATFSESSSIQLREGSYSYKVVADNFDTTLVEFTVADQPLTITVNPQYSKTYLDDLLQKEDSELRKLITSEYNSQSNITITNLKLYEDGNWAAGTLTPETHPRQLPDVYRFVLHKSNGQWKVIIPPTIAINKETYKNVPTSILYALYEP